MQEFSRSSFSNPDKALEWHRKFMSRVYGDATPTSFGPSTKIYTQLLRNTRLYEQLETAEAPYVGLVGSSQVSAAEFVDFIGQINPRSNIVIFDISTAILELIKEKVALPPTAQLIEADARQLQTELRFFALFTHHLFPHVQTLAEQYAILESMYIALAPGGGVFIVESNISELIPEMLAKAGFTDIQIDSYRTLSRYTYLQERGSSLGLNPISSRNSKTLVYQGISAVK